MTTSYCSSSGNSFANFKIWSDRVLNSWKYSSKILLVGILSISFSLQANERTNAITDDGQGVILYSNGTWAFKLEPTKLHVKKTIALKKNITVIKTTKPKKIKKVKIVKTKTFLKGKNNIYKIIYNDKLWKKTSSSNEDAEIQLEHKSGSGYAMVIFDRTPISLDSLKKQVLTNMSAVVSKVEIISEKKIRLNGHQIMVLKINSIIEETPFSYFNYYASGNWGTIQFVTYTATALMTDYETDFSDLLNGLTINK